MRITPVTFSGQMIFVGGNSIDLDYPIADAFQLGNKIIVLFDPDAYGGKFGQFKNLIALGIAGEKLWTAELPTTISSDSYYRISSREPLIADSLSSYSCEVDQHNGKIKSKTFFK